MDAGNSTSASLPTTPPASTRFRAHPGEGGMANESCGSRITHHVFPEDPSNMIVKPLSHALRRALHAGMLR